MTNRCWLSTRWRVGSTPGRWPTCVGTSPRARSRDWWRMHGSTLTRWAADVLLLYSLLTANLVDGDRLSAFTWVRRVGRSGAFNRVESEVSGTCRTTVSRGM